MHSCWNTRVFTMGSSFHDLGLDRPRSRASSTKVTVVQCLKSRQWESGVTVRATHLPDTAVVVSGHREVAVFGVDIEVHQAPVVAGDGGVEVTEARIARFEESATWSQYWPMVIKLDVPPRALVIMRITSVTATTARLALGATVSGKNHTSE